MAFFNKYNVKEIYFATDDDCVEEDFAVGAGTDNPFIPPAALNVLAQGPIRLLSRMIKDCSEKYGAFLPISMIVNPYDGVRVQAQRTVKTNRKKYEKFLKKKSKKFEKIEKRVKRTEHGRNVIKKLRKDLRNNGVTDPAEYRAGVFMFYLAYQTQEAGYEILDWLCLDEDGDDHILHQFAAGIITFPHQFEEAA